MAIDCDLYEVRNGAWAILSSTKGQLKQKDHAEILAAEYFATKQNRGSLCRLVQNAYPCEHCHSALLKRSSNAQPPLSIIVEITDNKGAYSACHTVNGVQLSQKGSVPCVIYYHNGACTYSNMTLAMQNNGIINIPAGFPIHPDF